MERLQIFLFYSNHEKTSPVKSPLEWLPAPEESYQIQNPDKIRKKSFQKVPRYCQLECLDKERKKIFINVNDRMPLEFLIWYQKEEDEESGKMRFICRKSLDQVIMKIKKIKYA